MTIREKYEEFLARRDEVAADTLGKYFLHQVRRYVHPFRICGNVWYLGDTWVCVHLIDTGEGLLLIDSGNCGAEAMLVQAIWEAGFRPEDVRWIIHSHGHLDHIGGSVFMREMFGTKLYLSEADAKMYRERPEYALMQDGSDVMAELFEPDVLIRDGDVMTFGKVKIEFVTVPGHTEGCVAMFFDIPDGDRVWKAGYYGGFGFNTLQREFLEEFGDPKLHMREVYLESLAKVRDREVDIFLGNHASNNRTLEKRAYQLEHPEAENPFIDPAEWGRFLDSRRDDLLALMERDPA